MLINNTKHSRLSTCRRKSDTRARSARGYNTAAHERWRRTCDWAIWKWTLLVANERAHAKSRCKQYLSALHIKRRMCRQLSSDALLSRRRACICIPHNKSLHSHSAGATCGSPSFMFNMLSVYLPPKWLYNNSILWREAAWWQNKKEQQPESQEPERPHRYYLYHRKTHFILSWHELFFSNLISSVQVRLALNANLWLYCGDHCLYQWILILSHCWNTQ